MKILIAGDFCPHDRVATMVANKDYSFFDGAKDTIKDADYSIVNFECPVVEGDVKPIDKCGPALRTERDAVTAIKYAGFDCVTLANNHFRDFGDDGCKTTLHLLKEANINYVGGGHNLAEAQQVLYKQLRDKRLAIVNFCENEFSIATESQAGSAPLESVDNYHQITEARRNADFVLVIVHGGHEHYQLPSPRMKKLYRFFVEIGADAVVNHHQHCYSGYEYYNGKPIVYGLGNFCFDWKGKRNSFWNEGYMLRLCFDGSSSQIELIPYVQCDDSATIELVQGEELAKFRQTVTKLNVIIADDTQLQQSFEGWINKNQTGINTLFSSWHNRYLNAAASRGWIPYLTSKKEYGAMLNRICCEAHRDITITVLKKNMCHK
ncbi:MAG: CapA family protein [Tidjanibacter sp.]|nr:CapA family protein [Tidjanibacter sp.]